MATMMMKMKVMIDMLGEGERKNEDDNKRRMKISSAEKEIKGGIQKSDGEGKERRENKEGRDRLRGEEKRGERRRGGEGGERVYRTEWPDQEP